jgi:hypothetical protein
MLASSSTGLIEVAGWVGREPGDGGAAYAAGAETGDEDADG